MLAMVLLILHAVGTWTYAALGVAAAIVSAALVGAVSIFSARMAGLGQGNNAWFVVPAVVFTALPLAARLWTLVTVEQSWWTRTVEFAPFLTGFAAPVLLLLMAYLELGRRARHSVHDHPGARASTPAAAPPTPSA
jgi:cytochrome c-type biogenesis protein CcmH/NrfG